MERESFEDHEVADKLNESFIAVKVDREERPDIDAVYMDVCQRLTGSGGWPLSIFLTPDQMPFYAGTYFPKYTMYGKVGFIDLLEKVKKAWTDNKDELIHHGNEIIKMIQGDKLSKGMLNQETLKLAFQQLMEDFDLSYGGFSHAPKFPTPHTLLFLFRYYHFYQNEDALNMCVKTLNHMYKGGIYDHLGGGFSRYSTDRQWLIPHFEKMLYDNALLILAYTQGYVHTKKERYKQIVEAVIQYLVKDMNHEHGGFYCAEDADSEGIEGRFYTFSKSEILSILGKEDGGSFCDLYGVTDKGNFDGRSILNLLMTDLEDLDLAENTTNIEQSKIKLLNYRDKRIRPHRDDKLLTSWNGLLIAALAFSGKVLDNPSYIEYAKKSAGFIQQHLLKEDGGLFVRYREGEAKHEGILEDYAFLIWGLIELYEASFDPFYLKWAVDLNHYLVKYFWDDKGHAFYLYGSNSESLIIRPKEIYDGAMPSGNSVAALNLLRLSRLTGDQSLDEKARQILEVFAQQVNHYPRYYTHLLQSLIACLNPNKDIVIAGNIEDEEVRDFISKLNQNSSSYFTIILNHDDSSLMTINQNLKEKGKINNKTTVYICENYSCIAPITNLDEALEVIIGKEQLNKQE